MTARLPLFAIPLLMLLTLNPLASATTSSENDAEIRALRAQLQQMKSDSQALEARLRELEAGSDGGSHAAAAPLRGPAPQAPHAPAPTTRTPMATPAPPLTPGYTPSGPALRQAADPAPYEAAAEDRLAMFRVAFSPYRWVPVGNRQLALFNTYDQAYLLGFATDCPGLLSATRIRIEDFSTHVHAGEQAVIADGQRCLIATIEELNINKLPKALRP